MRSEGDVTIQKQLAAITPKAELHRWVDELPDGIKGIIVIEMRDDPHDSRANYCYRHIGDVTVAEGLYMLKTYEHFLFDRLSDV